MVSIFSGEVNRTWRFTDGAGAGHEVVLYHHPLTGARAAMVDHAELDQSLGTSSVFHAATTTMPFRAGTARGTITIQRTSLVGFAYTCEVDGRPVDEATALVKRGGLAPGLAPGAPRLTVFAVRVVGRATTRDHAQPTAAVTWYLVEASARLEDGATATTRVHRRFRDFADFDETLQASLAGYASRSSLPKLPAKRPKIVQDHGSPEFLDEREKGLDAYVQRLVQVPHVWLATGAPAFVGLADAVREYSVVFNEKTLGFTVGRADGNKAGDFPAVVAECGANCPPEVQLGDLVSKISGRTTSNLAFQQCVAAIKYSQRPLVLHFLSPLSKAKQPKFTPPETVQSDFRDADEEKAWGGGNWGDETKGTNPFA